MKNNRAFYICDVCGNMVGLIADGGGTLTCCNQPMRLLSANTSDGAAEKHVPSAERSGDTITVRIGSLPHPMTPAHYIQWIAVAYKERTQRVHLTPEDKPEAVFSVSAGEPVTLFAYCNLHSLWSAELN